MAAAESPAGDAEPWQSWLPNHVVFLRLREGLKNQSPAEAEKPASSSPPSSPPLTRNLVLGLGGELFLWDGDGSSFLVVRLRGLGGAGEEPSLSQYQVRPGLASRASRRPGVLGGWAAQAEALVPAARPVLSAPLSSSFRLGVATSAASFPAFVPSAEVCRPRHALGVFGFLGPGRRGRAGGAGAPREDSRWAEGGRVGWF